MEPETQNSNEPSAPYASLAGYAIVWYVECDDLLCEHTSVMPQAYATLEAAERRAERLNRSSEDWQHYRVRSLAVVGRPNDIAEGRRQ